MGRQGASLISRYIVLRVMFIKCVHTLILVKDVVLLCEMLDEFVQEVRLSHVVQVVTDNIANYMVTDKLLMKRHPTLF
jgi:hypothetical protein